MRSVPAPGPHGGDGAVVARALGLRHLLDLSESLNPVAPDPVPVIARHLESLRCYPDAGAGTRALGEAMGVDVDRLLLTNGGAEAIALVDGELGGWVLEPEFALHPRGEGPLWRSNPHNPTGLLAAADEQAQVWDEAFYPLTTGHWTRGDAGAVVVGSLTKLLACPGLRLGYVLGDPEVVERCRRRQPQWSVNGLATRALADLLTLVDLPAWASAVAQLRTELVEILAAHRLLARPSQANWVLVDRPGLRQALAPLGVLVRDCTSFGLPGVYRIAVPSPDGMARLDAALSRLDRSSTAGRQVTCRASTP